jgi:hypothetical protein
LVPVALYAAYGSNMDPAQMLERCPHSPQRSTGWLEGWRLTFGGEDIGWDGALTTVVEDPGQRVFVVLYDVPEVDEKELDTWDGVTLGYYRKLKVRVQTLDEDALAWLYVLDAYEGGLPSARHMAILIDSAVKAGAPADYVDSLRARPSMATSSASTGIPTTAKACQFQVLTGRAAADSDADVRASSARTVSAATILSASPGSGAAGEPPRAAVLGAPKPAPCAPKTPIDGPVRERAWRCARICATAWRRREEPAAQA